MRWMTKGLDVTSIRALIAIYLIFAHVPIRAVAAGQDVPFVGVAVVDTDLHCSAASSYVTGELKKGAFTQVEQVIQGWYKVVPPDGSYSLIKKIFLTAQGDGSVGIINRGRAAVKAPNLKVKGNSYRTQVSLVKGTKVSIIGRYGGYYMIVPPEGAYVYAPGATIRRATREEARRLAAPKLPAPDSPQFGPDPPSVSTYKFIGPALPPSDNEPTPTPPMLPSPTAPEPLPPVAELGEPPVLPGIAELARILVDSEGPALIPDLPALAVDIDNTVLRPLGNPSTTLSQPPDEPDPSVGPGPEPIDSDPGSQHVGPEEPKFVPTAETIVDVAVERSVDRSPIVATQWLAKLDHQYEQASAQRLEQQPIDGLLESYRQIKAAAVGLSDAENRIVEARITALKRRAMLVNTLQQITQARQRHAVVKPVPPGESAAISQAPPVLATVTHAMPPRGGSVGRLVPSRVFDGNRLPLLLRLVDPATKRTLGYVRPGRGIEPARHIGRIVAFSSTPQWDPDLKVRLLEPSDGPVVLASP